jgi:hypothetical protein
MLVENRVRCGNYLLFVASLMASSTAGAATCKQQILDGARTLIADSPGSYEIYQVGPLQDTDLGYGGVLPDVISFEFYANGAPITAGTFDLGSGDNANYATCSQCVRVIMDIDTGTGVPQKIFYQTGGTLTVDAMTLPGSDPIVLSWQNVTLAEVYIDPSTFESTLVPNGDCFTIVPDEIFANDFE